MVSVLLGAGPQRNMAGTGEGIEGMVGAARESDQG